MMKIQKHLWINEAQDKKLKLLKKELGLNYGQIFRAIIDRDYLYINLYNQICHELKKQGNNLNQIARHTNTDKEIDKQILVELSKIREQQEEIKKRLYEIRG